MHLRSPREHSNATQRRQVLLISKIRQLWGKVHNMTGQRQEGCWACLPVAVGAGHPGETVRTCSGLLAHPQPPQLLWKIPDQKQREEVWLEVLEPIPGLGSGQGGPGASALPCSGQEGGESAGSTREEGGASAGITQRREGGTLSPREPRRR